MGESGLESRRSGLVTVCSRCLNGDILVNATDDVVMCPITEDLHKFINVKPIKWSQ